jgi:GNAT superfamily N-acetyltransferase
MRIHLATRDDVPALVTLNDAYMRELFRRPWNGTAEQLAVDLAEGVVHAAVTEARDAFVAWNDAYDLHHCIRGASICDLYVPPAARGRGIAACLLAFAAARIAERGGTYLVGTIAGDRSGPLAARVAEGWPTREFILGGRAFRAVAALEGATPRELARSMPPVAWNNEP